MSALSQGIKHGVMRALTITVLVAAFVGLAIYGGVQYYKGSQRNAAMAEYAFKAQDLRVGYCFEKDSETNFGVFWTSHDEFYNLDEEYDGDFYRCVEEKYSQRYIDSYAYDLDHGVDLSPVHRPLYIYADRFSAFSKCFAGMNAEERASLKAADCVIKTAGPVEDEQDKESKRQRDAYEQEYNAEQEAAQQARDKAYATAKPQMLAAIDAYSAKNDADHRAASVLASCKFEEGSGGYDVALDVYTSHSQQAVVAQRDVDGLFDNAREALCNAA